MQSNKLEKKCKDQHINKTNITHVIYLIKSALFSGGAKITTTKTFMEANKDQELSQLSTHNQ